MTTGYNIKNPGDSIPNPQPTVWTNNKAYKSRMQPDPNCDLCGKPETMEHLLCECENYSEPLWGKLADALTQLFNDISPDDVPRVDLGQTNIIFISPIPRCCCTYMIRNPEMHSFSLFKKSKEISSTEG
jgi:hypothetical protein